jgi:hypothetical protein
VEQLLGVRPDALNDLHSRGVPTRVYVPYAADWFRYLAATRGRVPWRLNTVAWVDRYGVVEVRNAMTTLERGGELGAAVDRKAVRPDGDRLGSRSSGGRAE